MSVRPSGSGASLTGSDPRDRPSRAFVEALRNRYPVEREVDRVLTRRMEHRADPPYQLPSVAELSSCLRRFLADTLTSDFEVSDERWLSGGASKMQMRFSLRWDDPEAGPTTTDLVVRMEPAESLNASSRLREFELLRAFQGVLPVPRPYWVDADARWFPQPALIYALAHGVTKPTAATTGAVTGLGTNFGPELRRLLAPQFVRDLARIHTFDHEQAGLDGFDRPAAGSTETAAWQVNRSRRLWEEDRGEELPLLDVATEWLYANLPVLDRPTVVHGDFRTGNFLFDEGTGDITAWLDWERGYIGDRHRDLAWSTSRVIGHYAEDGRTFLVCGLLPLEEFYEEYERVSGLPVDPERVRFYEILGRYEQVQTLLGTSYRVVRLGKSHQGILVARIEAAAYVIAEDLRRALDEVI